MEDFIIAGFEYLCVLFCNAMMCIFDILIRIALGTFTAVILSHSIQWLEINTVVYNFDIKGCVCLFTLLFSAYFYDCYTFVFKYIALDKIK